MASELRVGERCPKCYLDLVQISHRVEGKDVWIAADYCKECGWLASDAVRPVDKPDVHKVCWKYFGMCWHASRCKPSMGCERDYLPDFERMERRPILRGDDNYGPEVSPADRIPVVPHVTVEPNQPCAGARERYMKLPPETQMATQSAYLSDALEYAPTYARLSRDARKRLRMIQLDLVRWPEEILRLREDLAAAEAMLAAAVEIAEDMGSRYGYWQAFKEWWNAR